MASKSKTTKWVTISTHATSIAHFPRKENFRETERLSRAKVLYLKPLITFHFWQMIIENNVTCVVSTCSLVEKGVSKCNKFWPDIDREMEFDISQSQKNPEKIKVKLIEAVQESANLTLRKL